MDLQKWNKKLVSWMHGNVLCQSIVFTWQLEEAREQALRHDGPIVAGGPAVKLMGAPWAVVPEKEHPDHVWRHNPDATFTTRGCIRKCAFCAVPKIEGEFYEIKKFRPAPIICDNNLLASSRKHFERVIESARKFPVVDFNQGLDARLFKRWHATELAKLKHVKLRFALDHTRMAGKVKDAIDLARSEGLKDIGVYVLIGFRDKPSDALFRLELVRSWKLRPNPMRYHPLDAREMRSYVAPGWTEFMLRKTMKYYANLRFFEHIPFKDFDYNSRRRKA